MTVVVGSAIILAAIAGGVLAIARPTRTVLPLFAATLPAASVVKLTVPLPSPFNTLSSILGATVILACLGHCAIHGVGRAPTLPVGAWLAVLAWGSLTAFWALDPAGTVSKVTVAAPLVLLVMVVSIVPTDETDLDIMRLAVIASGIAVGMYAVILIAEGAQLPSHGASQRFSLATNPADTDPNILAASLILPMVLSVERILVGGSRWWSARTWRLLGAFGAFSSFLAILFTGSRGGLLAAVAAFILTLGYCRRIPAATVMVRRVISAILVLGLAAAVAVLAGRTLSPENPLGRVLSSDALRRITSTTSGSSGRFEIWTAGYLACLSHCAVGAGLGDYPDAYNEVYAFSAVTRNVGPNRPAHNIYLELLVETGVAGLALVATALALEWRVARRRDVWMIAPSLRAGLSGLLVANVFISALWFKYFWLGLILIRVAEGAAAARGLTGRDGTRASKRSLPYEDQHAKLLVRGHPNLLVHRAE